MSLTRRAALIGALLAAPAVRAAGRDGPVIVVGAGAAGAGTVDAANLLKPALARGRIRCVGATTLDEYRKYIEKDAALERRFRKVHVEEPSAEATVHILQGLRRRYEAHHGLKILDSTIIAVTQLAARYITGMVRVSSFLVLFLTRRGF